MVMLISRIPSLPLDISIAAGWLGMAIVYEGFKEVGPVLAIIVPTLIHLVKYVEGRIEKRELKQRITEVERRATEIEIEKANLKKEFAKFEEDRAAFRAEQRNAVQNILCHVEKMSEQLEKKEDK